MLDYVSAEALEVLRSCCCCLRQFPEKNLKTPYTYHEKKEIYLDMLKDCFDIHLDVDSDECGICAVCVGRLRDASDFKLQVQRSQEELRARLEAVQIKDETPNLKTEKDDDIKNNDNLSDGSPNLKTQKTDDDGKCGDLQGEEPVVKSEFIDDCDDFMLYYADEQPADNSYSIDDSDEDAESPLKDLPDAPTLLASLSAAAKEQLALTCSVRLERVDVARVAHLSNTCHRTFLDTASLETHVDRCGGGEYTCHTCGRQFKRKASFEKHVQTHMTRTSSKNVSVQKITCNEVASKKIFDQKKFCNEIGSKKMSNKNKPSNRISAKEIFDQKKIFNEISSKKISDQNKPSNQISAKEISDRKKKSNQKKISYKICFKKTSNQKKSKLR